MEVHCQKGHESREDRGGMGHCQGVMERSATRHSETASKSEKRCHYTERAKSFRVSGMMFSRTSFRSVGDKRHPCDNSNVVPISTPFSTSDL